MGADRVIAVNVGDLSDLETVKHSMMGLASDSIDAMMRANTKALIKQADIIINVPLEGYGSLDWRRSAELIEEGYRAAEAMREALLPLAVSEAGARSGRPPARRGGGRRFPSLRSPAWRASAPATSAACRPCWRATSALPSTSTRSRRT